jgi:hypothetical protein
MKPYTYLIKFKVTGQCYYGSRYKNVRLGLNPEDDLMIKYQTSSKDINDLIAQYGLEAFEWEVRRTFDTPEQASDWEIRVLKRCKVLESGKWFNGNIAGYIVPTEKSRQKISDFHKGKPKSEEHKKNLSESQKGKTKVNSKNQTPEYRALMSGLKSGSNNPMYGRSHSEESKKKIGEKNRIHMQGENNPMKKVKWTEERREHMRQIRAKRQPWTDEQKAAVASKLRGQKREKLYCSHCKKDIAIGWYNRHGDNCKFKKGN